MSTVFRPGTLRALARALTLVAWLWQPATGIAAEHVLVAERSLANLVGDARPLRLEFQHSERALSLPISARVEPVSLTLRLKVVQSITLAPERSQLLVRLNGVVAGQVPVNPARTVVTADIPLPVALLKPGYNELRFEGIQHYPTHCEEGEPPESWQEVDAIETVLRLEYRQRPAPTSLARLNDIFDERLWAPQPLTVFAPGASQAPAASTAVARGAALRYRFHPLQFSQGRFLEAARREATGQFPGLPAALPGDALVIGTTTELQGSVAADLLAQVKGPYLGAFRHDQDPTRAVVLVSGRDADELQRAGLAFSLARGLPLPDSQGFVVSEVRVPEWPGYAAENGVQADSSYRFSDLGLPTRSLTADAADLQVTLPPDLYASERATALLRLHLTYPAGLSQDSALYVRLNGHFAGSVPFADVRGERFVDYRLSLPLRTFRPGRNTLSFQAVTRSRVPGECAPRGARFPVTLHGDSEISLPPAGHYAKLPDLGLFRDQLFPHSRDATGAGLSLRLADGSADTLAAAWTLAAKLAQVRGLPLHQMEVGIGLPAKAGDRDLIVLAPADVLPAEFRAAAPVDLGARMRLADARGPLPQALPVPRPSWWQRMLRIEPPHVPAELAPAMPVGLSGQASEPERTAALMQFRNPDGGGTVTWLSAAPGDFAARSVALVDFKVWNQIGGDLVLWTDRDGEVTTQLIGRPWHVGSAGLLSRTDYWFSQYPWLLVGLVGGMLTLLALVVWVLLRRRMLRRQESGEPVEF